MENFAHNLSDKIALQMQLDDDKKSVIAYGLTAIFQMTTIAVLVSIMGLLCNFWYESMILFIGVGIIRKSTGGAHSQTMVGCLIISVFSIILLSVLSRYVFYFPINIYINIGISVMVYALCFIVFYKRVPVDTPNKPINNPDKIKRLRRQSFIILVIFFLLSIITMLFTSISYRFYSIAASIRLAMLWQLFTLTKHGAKFINKIDSEFSVQ